MSTQTLLPNGTRSGAGDFTVTGAASVHAALSDASDATYVKRTSTDNTKSFVVNMGTYTLAAGEAVQSVRIGVRMERGGLKSQLYVRQGYVTDPAAGTIRYAAADQYFSTLTPATTVYGAARTLAPDGQPWDQARLNDLVVRVTDYAGAGAFRSTLYEVFAEVTINEQPTVSVTGPTGTVTDTSRPSIEWTYADADGDPQSVYEVRVFTAAQYGAPGFDPATSTAAWETGLVSSADPGVVPTVDLENGETHRAYVRVGHALGTTVLLSAWDYEEFTVDYDSPPAPALSAAYSVSSNVVYVTATGRTNYLSTDDASMEGSAGTWAAISGCSVARSTVQALIGSASLAITNTSPGTMSARTGHYPVATDGQQIAARCDIRPDGSARTVRMLLRWTDGSTLLSTKTGPDVTEAGAAWTSVTMVGTPPAGATHVQVGVEVVSAASGEIHFVDKVSVHPGSTALWSPGGLYDAQVIVVERSEDDGTTWLEVDTVPAGVPTQVAQFDDYAAERDQAAVYRARVIGYAGQDAVAGPFSDEAAAFVTNDGRWWLKADGDPARNLGGLLVTGPLSFTREQTVGVFRPLGRSTPIVTSGDLYGLDGSYEVIVSGADAWAAAKPLLLDWTGDVIVQDPFGWTRRVRFVSREVDLDGAAAAPRRTITLGYVEVA